MISKTECSIAVTARTSRDKPYQALSEHQLRLVETCTGVSNFGKCRKMAITNYGKTPFKGIIHFEVQFQSGNPAFFMPAFLYNRNRGNVPPYTDAMGMQPEFPRLSLDLSVTGSSSYWMVRGDRLSHPISMAYDNGTVYGISGPPCNDDSCLFNGFSCRLGESVSSVGFTLGYENAPWLYTGCQQTKNPSCFERGSIVIGPEETKVVSVETFSFKTDKMTDMHRIIRHLYHEYHQAPRKASTIPCAVQDIAEAIYNDCYVSTIKNYSTQVYMQKDGSLLLKPMASIAWTGGVEIASPLLLAAGRLKNSKMRMQALEVIQNIVDYSMNPQSGFPFDAYDEDEGWSTHGWWNNALHESGHSSYLVGQALYYIIQAYQTEKMFSGQEHPDWLKFVDQSLAKIEMTKNEHYEVPHIWSDEDGHALDYDSFSGCWCVAAAAYLDKVRGTATYLESSMKSLKHYYNAYVSKLECYGTPHDTRKAVDSEGILSFIKAARLMHEISNEPQYLQMLEDGLAYEFTFKFCWNPPIQDNPLKKLGWSCCGGSVTSTCNPHIHPMSNNVADDIGYCYRKTHDPYYFERMKDTVAWGLQSYNTYDNEYDYGRKGWMSERFCYSEALVTPDYEYNVLCSTWRCFLPWGASNVLESLCGEAWELKEM